MSGDYDASSIMQSAGPSRVLSDTASQLDNTVMPMTLTVPRSPPINQDQNDNAATELSNPMSNAALNYTTDGTGWKCQLTAPSKALYD